MHIIEGKSEMWGGFLPMMLITSLDFVIKQLNSSLATPYPRKEVYLQYWRQPQNSVNYNDLIVFENDVHISPTGGCHCRSSDVDEWFHGIDH